MPIFEKKQVVFMGAFVRFLKKEPVLCIAAVCALLSAIAVPPDRQWLSYIDFRVLGLLWCLMAVVAALRSCGVFEALAYALLKNSRGGWALSVALVLLPFFVSMAVTNDVALIIFVPFALQLLSKLDFRKAAAPIVVLQTIAANLGSMATPVGNPQNLYLYARYELGAGVFFAAILPLVAVSLVALIAASIPVLPRHLPQLQMQKPQRMEKRRLIIYLTFFVLCLLSVFRLVEWWVLTILVLARLILKDRKLLREPDYGLLVTFVCFFILSGNLGRVEAVRNLLQSMMEKSTLLTATLASQVISNVPAAVLLSSFTNDWRGLLLGVDIGGLGTPVASLASLISLKFYLKESDARPGFYMALFTIANVIGLVLLLGVTWIL